MAPAPVRDTIGAHGRNGSAVAGWGGKRTL